VGGSGNGNVGNSGDNGCDLVTAVTGSGDDYDGSVNGDGCDITSVVVVMTTMVALVAVTLAPVTAFFKSLALPHG
jgi:hypothetical protein